MIDTLTAMIVNINLVPAWVEPYLSVTDWSVISRVGWGLLAVCVLIVLLGKLTKKGMDKQMGVSGKNGEILSVDHLSPKQKLIQYKIGDRVLLLGVTPSNITRLYEGVIRTNQSTIINEKIVTD